MKNGMHRKVQFKCYKINSFLGFYRVVEHIKHVLLIHYNDIVVCTNAVVPSESPAVVFKLDREVRLKVYTLRSNGQIGLEQTLFCMPSSTNLAVASKLTMVNAKRY